ncbi:bifunctional 2-polyprenyl-6-hydroxyphenol methylase/3-demethylubiquinol 3-O-methyltransferase UbiG [Ensifer sp. ENS03]|uniref:class I SAM-dependent methyltransferase n=1 Tax=Ensifer sp. ENS03 TaxID=2769283 RepID=UPI001FEEC845|nr:class I SAM-dependent methyltransferase [Ensifer sp. ENS03]
MFQFWKKWRIRRDASMTPGNLVTTKIVDRVFDQYSKSVPSDQNAIDALPGWNSAFPAEAGVTAGTHPLFADGRIEWALAQFGSIEGRKLLEIGPLEGMHTYMLDRQRPARIDAVEANQLCFLRCLVTKQILQLNSAHFYLGDAQRWLEEQEIRYDLTIASGVLYHMHEPAEFLVQLARRTDSVFIWTHFFLDEVMPEGDVRRLPFSGKVERRVVNDVPVRYYERGYFSANSNKSFCGGMRDRHYWMHRDDILQLLRSLGFQRLEIAHEELDHSGGPCFCLFAQR